jgi:hypothetical protein
MAGALWAGIRPKVARDPLAADRGFGGGEQRE